MKNYWCLLYILGLFFISLSCSSQELAKLNSLSFGKSKLSLDTIIKYSKDTNAMKKLTGQPVSTKKTIDEIGDGGEFISLSYENGDFLVFVRSQFDKGDDGKEKANNQWIEKNARGEESALDEIAIVSDMKGLVYINGIEVYIGTSFTKISPKFNENLAILLDDRGGGISIYAQNNKILSITYSADIWKDGIESDYSYEMFEYIKVNSNRILPEGVYKDKILKKMNEFLQKVRK